MHMFKTRS